MFLDNPIHAQDLPENEQGSFDPIPEGKYTVQIGAADLNPTKDGSGQYIKLKLNVTGPSHSGRVIFSNVNIRNKSSAAETIGRQQLRSIMTALGLATLNDTDQLIGGHLTVKIGIRPAEGQYEAQNDVKSYSAADNTQSSAPAFTQQSVTQSAPQADAGKASPPWAKK